MDKFNQGCSYEKYLLTGNKTDLNEFKSIMRTDSHNWESLALDYLNAGLYEEVVAVLKIAEEHCVQTSPMMYYYTGYAYQQVQKNSEAEANYIKAASHDPSYCFPNRLEAILALQAAIAANPKDAKAWYYLGNLWYDKRQYDEAIEAWENSVSIDGSFATSKRNLALGYFNKLSRRDEAIVLLEEAFAANSSDARILMELDQLYKRMNYSHKERLSLLDDNRHFIDTRDDLYLEYATLLNQTGRYAEAKEMIDGRKFFPWEGGEGKVPAQYQIARTELAKQAMEKGNYSEAVNLLKECLIYPENLGEGKLIGAQDNDFNYLLGCAYEKMGDKANTKHYFSLASVSNCKPSDAIYYNDQKPDKIFYQGLALLKLGKTKDAEIRFNELIAYGKKQITEEVKIDYFAVSLPDLLIWEDDLERRNTTHCHYLMGLGEMGLQNKQEALKHLREAANMDNNHQGVKLHLKMFEAGKLNLS